MRPGRNRSSWLRRLASDGEPTVYWNDAAATAQPDRTGPDSRTAMALETAEGPGPTAGRRRLRPARRPAIGPPRTPAPTMTRPWVLAELNYGQVKSRPPFELAVLPLGATEPHNLHLP